jgi:hypothetical protein
LSNPSTTTTSNSAIPTAAQLADTRLKQWHQQGEALLTIENLRAWINAAGLVVFAPRPQIASPAPSLVEAVLGAATPNPTLEQTSEARSLLARLVAEGLAVPLNLLGPGAGTVHASAPGDTPDFVASTAVFSYVFTLRGDKAWKQPPATSGALKVSNLAHAIHEALSRGGPLSAYDLSTEVGKEVTEAAVLRSLAELWAHLRVLPLLQPDGRPTLWELTSARFTKQIKAGANAGQPSALSALISLYLGQAVVASEDEIESFLSPLAPRSRIRDVIHALLSARQLDTVAVEGRTMLHVAGALPLFLTPEAAVGTPESAVGALESQAAGGGEIAVAGIAADGTEDADSAGEMQRITKFVPKPRKIGTGYLAKAKPSGFRAKPGPFERGSKPSSKPSFKPREGFAPPSARERRPFSKPAARGFDKPWDEEKTRRLAAARKPSEVPDDANDLAVPKRTRDAAESAQPQAKRAYKPRTEVGDRGKFTGKPAFGKRSYGDKPAFGVRPRFGGDARPPRRDFAPRSEGDAKDARAPRKTFSKPGTFGRKREGFAAKSSGDARPPRREFTPRPRGDRPARADGGSFAPRKPYAPRGAGFFSAKPRPSDDRQERAAGGPRSQPDRGPGTESGKRVYRKFDAPRDRPARTNSSDRPVRAEGSGGGARKPTGDFAPRKFTGKPAGKSGGFARKPGSKPGVGFGGKRNFVKPGAPFAGKPASTFAKFSGNKKPFGKRPPGRKFKPTQGESS